MFGTNASASSVSFPCTEDETCVEKSRWHLGIAFGVGIKTNPLVNGDDIPLVILPDIAWYAHKAYFDNGELGYQWINQPKIAFETFLQLDRERAFFSFWHPANILVPIINSAAEVPASVPVPSEEILTPMPDEEILTSRLSLSIEDIASRKWAINGGLRGHYFLSNGEWQLTFQQDISNVHKGQQVGLQFSHKWQWHEFRLGVRIGTDWKSARLIDYYYGVSQKDTEFSNLYFNGESGWQTYMSINVQKPINKHWSWLANIGYRRLPVSLTNSPLIEQNTIRNVFLGIAYRF